MDVRIYKSILKGFTSSTNEKVKSTNNSELDTIIYKLNQFIIYKPDKTCNSNKIQVMNELITKIYGKRKLHFKIGYLS